LVTPQQLFYLESAAKATVRAHRPVSANQGSATRELSLLSLRLCLIDKHTFSPTEFKRFSSNHQLPKNQLPNLS